MSNVTIRQVADQEMLDILYRLDNYAFRPTPPMPERTEWEARITSRKGTSYYAVFEGDLAVSIAACIPMQQNVRGKIFPMLGIADVSTHPAYRRKGYVRLLMRRSLAEFQAQDYAFSCLYPFRESFYERLGYITFPLTRKAIFSPGVLQPLLKTQIDGEVRQYLSGESFEANYAFFAAMQKQIHGMALFAVPQKEASQANRMWVAQAWVDGEMVGLMAYSLKGDELTNFHLVASRFLYRTRRARYLLLEWIARHIDQAGKVDVWLPAYEEPTTWVPDLRPQLEPAFFAPMGRVLDLSGLQGLPCGSGCFNARIIDPDCPWNEGSWEFDATGGSLKIRPASQVEFTLHIQGFGALVYGVNDPEDLFFRGWGDPDPAQQSILRAMFSAQRPYLNEYF